jgi:hypothetical protein
MPTSKSEAKSELSKNKSKSKEKETKIHHVGEKLQETKSKLDKYYVGDRKFSDLLDEFMKKHPGCTQEEMNAYSEELMSSESFHSKE